MILNMQKSDRDHTETFRDNFLNCSYFWETHGTLAAFLLPLKALPLLFIYIHICSQPSESIQLLLYVEECVWNWKINVGFHLQAQIILLLLAAIDVVYFFFYSINL